MPTFVTLHIYDVFSNTAVAGVNMVFRAVGTGAFHAGVEVYGREWSYGYTPDCTGLFVCPPKGCTAHAYRESVPMGDTFMSKHDVDELIEEVSNIWVGYEYDLLRHNCCHFADDLCKRLGVGPVPSWVTSLAGVGAMLRSAARIGVGGVGAGVAGVAGIIGGRPSKGIEDWEDAEDGKRLQRMATKELDWQPNGYYNVGDMVEVFSNSLQVWCPGHIEGTKGPMVIVAFQVPGSRGEVARKELPAKHMDLRRVNQDAWASLPPRPNSGRFQRGDKLEVFSHSQQAWCAGMVEKLNGDLLVVAFQVPGRRDEWARKEIPGDSRDLRKPESGKDVRPDLRRPSADMEIPSIGDWVEVFSNSRQTWCPGRISKIRDGALVVVFQVPDAGNEEWVEKLVPPGSPGLRRSAMLTAKEESFYQKCFSEISVKGSADVDKTAEFLRRSGMQRRVLKEVWAIAVPERKTVVSFQEFSIAARLTGHCQVMSEDPNVVDLLVDGGEPLRTFLLKCVRTAPVRLPDFGRKV